MLRINLALLFAFALMAAGCGYSSHNYMKGNGMPAITSLAPASTTAEGGGFVLIANGSGFDADSVVYWGTMTRMTTYVSTTKVTANITAADIMSAGTVEVYVHSGGANSNTTTFTIQ